MAIRYEEPKAPRFRTVMENGREEIRVPARRNWFALLFLPVWLTAWTIGGGVAVYGLITTLDPFLAVWLCFWAIAWLFAAATIAWMLAGAEIVSVTGGDLDVGYRLFGYERAKRYRGDTISALGVASGRDPFRRLQLSVPFLPALRTGAVKFDYGARTIYFGGGIDEAEGRMIVDSLKRRLPAAAAD